MTSYTPRPRPPRPGIFRRRMILQLTSLLDLMLILVFVQYLQMQQSTNFAVARETNLRRQAQLEGLQAVEQRDVLIQERNHNLNEVWDLHVNGRNSIYPNGSVLITFGGQNKVIVPRDPHDFVDQFYVAVHGAARPTNPCLLVWTIGDVKKSSVDITEGGLDLATSDPRLLNAWGGEPMKFIVVNGGHSADAK